MVTSVYQLFRPSHPIRKAEVLIMEKVIRRRIFLTLILRLLGKVPWPQGFPVIPWVGLLFEKNEGMISGDGFF